MLEINWDDVQKVLGTMIPHLVVIGIVLVAAIVVTVLAMKAPKNKKILIRGSAWVAALLVVAIVINLICVGPMVSMLNLISATSHLKAETTSAATDLVVEMAEEGIVLVENDDNILPLSSGAKLNVFGWASTNPCYGGTGSGALNDAYPTVTLLQGLSEAGIELNTDLEKFYTDYKADRPAVITSAIK